VNCHEEDRSADFWERVKDFDVGFKTLSKYGINARSF
jgi:hypothetical protein